MMMQASWMNRADCWRCTAVPWREEWHRQKNHDLEAVVSLLRVLLYIWSHGEVIVSCQRDIDCLGAWTWWLPWLHFQRLIAFSVHVQPRLSDCLWSLLDCHRQSSTKMMNSRWMQKTGERANELVLDCLNSLQAPPRLTPSLTWPYYLSKDDSFWNVYSRMGYHTRLWRHGSWCDCMEPCQSIHSFIHFSHDHSHCLLSIRCLLSDHTSLRLPEAATTTGSNFWHVLFVSIPDTSASDSLRGKGLGRCDLITLLPVSICRISKTSVLGTQSRLWCDNSESKVKRGVV